MMAAYHLRWSREWGLALRLCVAMITVIGCRTGDPAESAASPSAEARHEPPPIVCEPSRLEDGVSLFVAYPDGDDQLLFAAVLLDACGRALPGPVERALRDVHEGVPDPDRVAALPAELSSLVDLSGCTPATKRALEEAYAQMRRDARHRVPSAFGTPEMEGGIEARDDDLEVTLTHGTVRYRGIEVPADARLGEYVPERPQGTRFVVLLDDHETVASLRPLLTKARGLGFSSYGLLVVNEGHYRVLPIVRGDPDGTAEFPLRMRDDGFVLAHTPQVLPPKPRGLGAIGEPPVDYRIDVPLKRPLAPVDDSKRWDYDALEAEVVRRLAALDHKPTASVWADDSLLVRDVVAAVQRLRGPNCEADGGSECRVSELKWRF